MFVVFGGAEHDHAAVERELGMADASVRALVDGVALKSEDVAEPIDGGGGIAVAQGGDDSGFVVCGHEELLCSRKKATRSSCLVAARDILEKSEV